MRRLFIGASTLALGVTLGAAPVSAQFFVGGFGTMPSGDYGDYAKTGWMVEAGYGFWSGADDKLTLWVAGGYGSNSHEGDSGDKTNLLTVLGEATFDLTNSETGGPYLIGAVGYMSHMYKPGNDDFEDDSAGGIAFGGGAGFSFGKFWVEGRYMTASIEDGTTAYIQLGAGISF